MLLANKLPQMTAVKNANRFRKRQGAAVLACFITWGLIMVILTSLAPESAWRTVLAIADFVLLVAVLAAVTLRMGRSFGCPQCGGQVAPPLETDGKAGTPILRRCHQCDVLWQVGVESDP